MSIANVDPQFSGKNTEQLELSQSSYNSIYVIFFKNRYMLEELTAHLGPIQMPVSIPGIVLTSSDDLNVSILGKEGQYQFSMIGDHIN